MLSISSVRSVSHPESIHQCVPHAVTCVTCEWEWGSNVSMVYQQSSVVFGKCGLLVTQRLWRGVLTARPLWKVQCDRL